VSGVGAGLAMGVWVNGGGNLINFPLIAERNGPKIGRVGLKNTRTFSTVPQRNGCRSAAGGRRTCCCVQGKARLGQAKGVQ